MGKGKILVVDDNKSILSAVEILLQDDFEDVVTIANPNQLPSLIETGDFDLILLDMNFSAGVNTGNEGLYWLSRIKEIKPDLEVVLFTAYGDVELAVKALKQGAADFILKPWDNEKLKATLRNVFKLQQSKKEIKKLKQKENALKSEITKNKHFIIAQSPQMLQILKLVRKVAITDANVLITGDNGTGKELIARELHRLSTRADEILVSVDMGAISETLFESELFGHKKGAFTDAKEDRTGKIENAHGGTLFLDEITNLPLSLQPVLLRMIEDSVFRRVGGVKDIGVDVRIVAASNLNIAQEVQKGNFRDDLYYRLNVIPITVPPLRKRGRDVLLLADHFVHTYSSEMQKDLKGLSPETEEAFMHRRWPGNVRELKNLIEREVLFSKSQWLSVNGSRTGASRASDTASGVEEILSLKEMERQYILKVLEASNQNKTRAAKILGISRTTLRDKIIGSHKV